MFHSLPQPRDKVGVQTQLTPALNDLPLHHCPGSPHTGRSRFPPQPPALCLSGEEGEPEGASAGSSSVTLPQRLEEAIR